MTLFQSFNNTKFFSVSIDLTSFEQTVTCVNIEVRKLHSCMLRSLLGGPSVPIHLWGGSPRSDLVAEQAFLQIYHLQRPLRLYSPVSIALYPFSHVSAICGTKLTSIYSAPCVFKLVCET